MQKAWRSIDFRQYAAELPAEVSIAAMCAELRSFSLFCALILLASGARELEPSLKCEKTIRTCEEILREVIAGPDNCPPGNEGNIFSHYSIDDTQLIQPSFTLTVNSSKINDDAVHNFGRSGYAVGYEGCTSDPTKQCYVSPRQIPTQTNGNYVHIVSPPESAEELPVGDQCTFFGCFVYTEVNKYDVCIKQIRGKIFEKENITILATCDPRHSVENGSISFEFPRRQGEYIEGTVANVTCNEGFVATYRGISECQGDGTWNTTFLPTCEITCPDPVVDNSTINPVEGHYLANNSVRVTCDEGYTGGGSIICGADGNWTSPLPTCSIVTCPDPVVDNSTINPVEGHYLANNSVRVTCDEGYTGGGSIICGADGNWTSSLPTCSIVECPKLGEIVGNGKVRLERPQYWEYLNIREGYVPVNTSMRVTCDWRYIGDGSIICGNNGNWSAPLPSCSTDHSQVIIGVAITTLTLVTVALVLFIFIILKFKSYRNNTMRRFKRYFTIQAKKESLDQNYTPIDLHKHKKLSISLSIRTNNDYYEITADSVSSPIITTPLHGEAQQSQSVDNVSKLPLAHTNIIKNTDAMSPDKTNSSWTSLPPMAHSQNENTYPGTVSTELSNNQEEPAGIVFQPSSGIENGRGEQLITSGIGFEFTDTKSSSETESSFNFPVDISESEVLPTNLPDSSNIQDSEITKGQTDGAPLSETGYTNVPETISPLSPETPSDVTLAFATMSQPAGPFKQSGPDYESQLDRESGSERSPVYVNSGSSEDEGQYTAKSASSYIDESTTHYMAESSLGKSSTTGYITESSMIISSSDYVKGSSEGKSSVDYVGNTGEGQSFYDRSLGGDLSSTYISESDLGNGHMRSFEPLPNDKARLPGTTQFMSDHDSSSASQVNSGSLGYIILDDLNTSSTT